MPLWTGYWRVIPHNSSKPKYLFEFIQTNLFPSCSPYDEEDNERETRRKLKEERLRKKERKKNKKARMEKECIAERMNCFSHDNNHWKTAPLWNDQPFCFCMNANNNTYTCIRTINQTHNYLYCEFTTGLITYYNLRIGQSITTVPWIECIVT